MSVLMKSLNTLNVVLFARFSNILHIHHTNDDYHTAMNTEPTYKILACETHCLM